MAIRTLDEVKEDMRNFQEEEAAKLRADTKWVREFEDMMRTPGWKLYMELLNNKVGERMKDVLEPTANALASEHNKGAVYGILWARDLPATTVAAHKASYSDPATEENSQ